MVIKAIKIFYLLISVAYLLTIAIYFLRFEISYRFVNARPEILKERSLTFEEHKGLEKAQKIRNNISTAFLWFSLFVAITSGLIWYFKPIDLTIFLKAVFFMSIFWTLLLKIAQGIHFIPTPPIR